MTKDHIAFRRLPTTDRIRELRGQQFERDFLIERDGIDKEKRTVWMSIASEQPYERWWGIEVLDISTDAIIVDRLRSGAALLVDHDPTDQVGVIEQFQIKNKRLRVLARFGRSARAEEIFQDVVDGIRRNTSVGYRIVDLVLEKQEQDISTYRVTQWEPYEGSLVAIPADSTVGVGRKLSFLGDKNMPENNQQQNHQTRSEKIHEVAEAQRIAQLYQCGEDFASYGGREVAREMIATPGANFDDMKKRLAEKLRAREPKASHTAAPAELPPFGSLARASLPHGKLRIFTGEGGEYRAFAFGMFLQAQLTGRDDAVRWIRENGIEQRYINSSVNAQGGFLVPDTLSSEMIKNMDTHGVYRREARVWPMSSELLSVPTRTGGVTARFLVNDNETTPSDPSFGNVNLTTKEVMAVTNISRATMEDSAISLGDHVAFEITEAFATLEDQCGFIGDGSSTYGGMRGVIPQLAAGSKSTAAAAHDTVGEIDVTDLAQLMAMLPQYAQPNAKWFMSMAMYGAICQRLLLQAGGNTVKTLESGASVNPSFAGFPVVLSPVLPSDLTADYTGTTMLLFGDLQRASAFGDRRQISLMVDPYTLAGKAQIRILGYERFDIVNHGVGTATTAGPIVGLVGGI